MNRFYQFLSFTRYFFPDFAAKVNFHYRFDINSLIPDEFTVHNTFVDFYLNKLKDLFEKNIIKKSYNRFVMCVLIVATIQWIYFLFIERDREYQISLGDFFPLMDGDETYTKLSLVIGLIYAILIMDLFYPFLQSKRKEFKWVELFECLRGNLSPRCININEGDGEIMRKGNKIILIIIQIVKCCLLTIKT